MTADPRSLSTGADLVAHSLALPPRCADAKTPAESMATRPHPGAPSWSIGFGVVGHVDEWDICQTDEVAAWLRELQDSDPRTADLVDAGI